MKVTLFDSHPYERDAFGEANARYGFELAFLDLRLTPETAFAAAGAGAVCAFVNDKLTAETLRILKDGGVGIVALRSAGFNHVDLRAAAALGLPVVRVPEYSPYAVAEHVVALIQTLNRKTHRAYNRVREGNFSLNGLVGVDLHGKTIGIIGAGKIGKVLAKIMRGFGCRVLLCDRVPDDAFAREHGCRFAPREEVFRESDIISLNLPLSPETRHCIDAEALAQMKRGVMLINTGRGGLIDTQALIKGLKSGHIGAAGLDVYEEEEGVFFRDLSGQILTDDVLARLLTFPNVIVTSHQAFLTREALQNIADTTLENLQAFERGGPLVNEVRGP